MKEQEKIQRLEQNRNVQENSEEKEDKEVT
jgi:hypothetical protein